MLQLLLFSGFAFFLMLPLMQRTLTITLDFDWFYRRAVPTVLRKIFAFIWQVNSRLRQELKLKLTRCLAYIAEKNNRISGLLSRDYPSGNMAMWVAIVLASYLFLSFIQ